jgi:hypothetical protein
MIKCLMEENVNEEKVKKLTKEYAELRLRDVALHADWDKLNIKDEEKEKLHDLL